MKKNFVKKLALGLALVMAVTSVPASSEAAAAPGFKSDAVKVRVGQTKKYSTENSKKYSVKFKIGNKKVATIKYTAGSKSVKVTGVAEGKTTLRADFKSYKTKKVTTAKVPVTVLAAKEEAPVVVAPELATVTQKAANVFELGFTADASAKFTKDNLKVESADGTYTLTVKSLEFAADGKSAKVTTYGNLVDKTVFNVTCGDKTVSFTASVGAVKTAVINTVQAEANVRTNIKFTLYDANGIDVTNAVAIDKYVSLYVDGDYYEVNTAIASKANLTLANVGGTVAVTLIYDPVAATGEVITVTGTITCVDTKQSVGQTTYFTKGGTYGTNQPKIYLNSFAEDVTLYADDDTEIFHYVALDKNGVAIEYDSYEVESSNEDVITVSDGTSANAKYIDVAVTPQGVGTAKVVIKATKNDVETVYAATVVVKAERKLTSIVLDKSTVSITAVSGGAEFVNENDTVAVMLMDQYGNLMDDADLDVSFTAAQYDGDELEVEYASSFNGSVDVKDTEGKNGSYIVVVEATDGERTISKKFAVKVRVVNGKLNPTYKIEYNTNTMDLNPEVRRLTTNPFGSVEVRVAEYYGTVFAGYVGDNNASGNDVEYLTVKTGGKYFTTEELTNLTTSGITTSAAKASTDAANLADSEMTSGVLTLTTMDAQTANSYHFRSGAQFEGEDCVAPNGTYTTQAVITGTALKKSVAATANFTVKNSMELPTVTVDATYGEETEPVLLAQECLTADVDVLDNDDASIVNVYGKDCVTAIDTLNEYDKMVVKYVQVKNIFGIGNLEVTYNYYVPVSRTFTAK